MTDLEKWANAFDNPFHMMKCTGLSWYICNKLRKGQANTIRQSSIKTAQLVMSYMSDADPTKAVMAVFRTKHLPYGWFNVIKVLARSVVAKHQTIHELNLRDYRSFTSISSSLDPCTTFFAELQKAERLLATLYKRYPTQRMQLFGGTGFIELMKMYGENIYNLKHYKRVYISPADNPCEPLNEGESQ